MRSHLHLFLANQINGLVVRAQETAGDVLDPAGQGCAEQECLHLRGPASRQYPLNVVYKAHVEHLITLI